MNKTKPLVSVLIRYILILLAGLGSLFIFYKTFTLPTTFLSFWTLKLLGKTSFRIGELIFLNNLTIVQIAPACVAGSAYYLLFILAMSVNNLKISKRILLLVSLFATFLLFNVARITLLATLTQSTLFNTTHTIFWYLISTIFVVAIWLFYSRIFKIKSIPIYSDLKYLYKQSIKKTKKSKRTKKN